jgi:hypothetical protein
VRTAAVLFLGVLHQIYWMYYSGGTRRSTAMVACGSAYISFLRSPSTANGSCVPFCAAVISDVSFTQRFFTSSIGWVVSREVHHGALTTFKAPPLV